jgi:hypothetical protein
VRARSTLAVALLVPSIAWGAPEQADEPRSNAASVVVDLAPAPGLPGWLASAFEQSITRELAGFERLAAVAKVDVDTHTCGADRECRLRAYSRAAIDIVLFGVVSDGEIDYELYQTWTPARVAAGAMDTSRGQSAVGFKHEARDAFHPVLKHGGLLDQKPHLFDRRAGLTAGATPAASSRGLRLAIACAFALGLALPFLLLALRTRRPRAIAEMPSARWVAASIAAGLPASVILDPRWLAQLVTSWPYLFAGLGGLGWGALLVVAARAAFPPLDGLERVYHRHLLRMLTTWFAASAQRILLLALLYAPFGVLAAALARALAIPPLWAWVLLAPAIAFLARLWFSSWVECLAVLVDRRLVDGGASANDPWSREIADYFMGYVRRTGWDLDPGLLASVLFLPGKGIEGVVAYGGGSTPARIVVDKSLLELAMGPLVEIKPAEQPALWPDWTTAAVIPLPASSPLAQPKAPLRALPASSLDGFRRRNPRTTSYPGMQRKPLGQAATLLGHVMPAPGQTTPLISDNPRDLAVVRELLSEHYPWFAPDPDEEYDATDPTDKDLLFGALALALGAVRRRETQLATARLALGERLARWSTRATSRLADGYAAINYARHHLIQYIYYLWSGKTGLLTARAPGDRLNDVTAKILLAVEQAEGQQRRQRVLRSRMVWLSQFFGDPIVERRLVSIRRLAVAGVLAAAAVAAGVAVTRSISYHPIYVQRIEAQERELARALAASLPDGKSKQQKGPADGEPR